MPTPMLSLTSFFTIAEREYQSFTFDAGARTTVRNIILAFCIGIILAAIYMLYQKRVPGAIIRAYLHASAHDSASARTPEELGLTRNPLLRYELKHNLTLKRFLREADRKPGHEELVEQAYVRYYIPEGLKYRAEIRYDKKGSGLFSLILTIVITVALGIAVIKLLPAVLGLFDNFIK